MLKYQHKCTPAEAADAHFNEYISATKDDKTKFKFLPALLGANESHCNTVEYVYIAKSSSESYGHDTGNLSPTFVLIFMAFQVHT